MIESRAELTAVVSLDLRRAFQLREEVEGEAMTSNGLRAEALAIHSEALVVDGSIVAKYDDGHFDRLAKGGVTAENHTVSHPESGLLGTILSIEKGLQFIANHRAKARLVEEVRDIKSAKRDGRVAIIFGPQDADFVEYNIGLLRVFHRMGVRILQIAYQKRNLIGDGCGERDPAGLSEFGHQVIREMNKIGIVVDLSHCSPPTTDDAIEASTKPVIFSHANPRARADHIRSKTDEQIHALAANGGVMGVTAYSPITQLELGRRPTLDDFLGHIEYIVDLVGSKHVGIGSDIDENSTPKRWEEFKAKYPELAGGYEYTTKRVEGFEDITLFPAITVGLIEKGYSKKEVQGILGGNFLRVFQSNWGG